MYASHEAQGMPTFNKKRAKPIASDVEVAAAGPGDNLRLGGGLYLWVTPRGTRYFQLRLSIGGRGTTLRLGQFPELSLEQARAEAANYQREVALARRENRKAKFSRELGKVAKGKKPLRNGQSCFRNMDDARQFIQSLSQEPMLSKEIRLAIWLQLLLPSRPSEILSAKWSEFDRATAAWAVDKNSRANTKGQLFVPIGMEPLSEEAVEALKELQTVTGDSEHLFPSLSSLSREECEDRIVVAKQACGLSAPVELNGFREFFRAMAYAHSCFREEFIDAVIAHKAGKRTAYDNPAYEPQRRALASWWGWELRALRFPAPPPDAKTLSGI
jgi:integrase